MNPLAQDLNVVLEKQNPAVLRLLSPVGKELYFPTKGILAQSAEAKEKAKKFNATIGTATMGNDPLVLPSLQKYFANMSPAETFNYAPSYGLPALRTAWAARLPKVNPSLAGKTFSNPVVTGGITHGLSLASDLFAGPGDVVLIPDQMWEYKLIFETRRGAEVKTWSFFHEGGLNLAGLSTLLENVIKSGKKKAVLLLNFPNNPTGYSITKSESVALLPLLKNAADKGLELVVILDDAYTGLFFEDNVDPESLFSRVCDLHESILAVKLDGFTKEYFAWGVRVAFVTYGVKGGTKELYAALEHKTAGAVRAGVSNASAPGQAACLKALNDPAAGSEAKANGEILKARALKVKEILSGGRYDDVFKAYPFNSGYFMLLKLAKLDSETFRKHLLEKHGVGVIATSPTDVRVAFSCVKVEDVPELFEILHKAGKELG